ncbi:MAG: hypothetical protein PHG06_00490 [Parabacteroides sp.]|nr:hypothetical protein [Parabacteroides sp.]
MCKGCDPANFIEILKVIGNILAVIGIIGIEIALIITGNDGMYALPLVAVVCLILGVKIPEETARGLVGGVLKK